MSNGAGRLMFGELLLSRADVKRHALALSDRLTTVGVRSGDRVTLQAENSPEFVIALLALIHKDASIVLLDANVSERERRRAIAMSSAEWLLHGRTGGDLAAEDTALPGPNSGTGALTCLYWFGRVGCGGSTAAVAGQERAALTFDAWRRRRDGLIVWSSGSTGDPKGIVPAGSSMLDNRKRTQERVGYRTSDVFL